MLYQNHNFHWEKQTYIDEAGIESVGTYFPVSSADPLPRSHQIKWITFTNGEYIIIKLYMVGS